MKKISKIILIIFMLLTTACGTNQMNDKQITTKIIVAKSSGALMQEAMKHEGDEIVESIENDTDILRNGGSSSVINKNENKKSSNDQLNKENNNTDSNPTSKPVEETINVSVTIDCKTILDNMNDLEAGYVDTVKAIAGGIILDTVNVKVKKNSTVFEALEMVSDKYNLDLKYRKSPYGGMYVYEIGLIAEKICGGTSGWMYSVNNVYPGHGASSYRLKDGDKIAWRFTCKPGDLK